MIKKDLFKCHVFVCTNHRDSGRECCAAKGSQQIRDDLKKWASEKYGARVRINNSGCLDHCEQGVSVVVYPEGEWHFKISQDNLDQLKSRIDSLLKND